MGNTYRMINERTGQTIADRLALAEGVFSRGRGLLGRRSLPHGEGLLLTPCNGVHTFFMLMRIDVALLRDDGTVMGVSNAVSPFRFVAPRRGVHHVLEMGAGQLAAADVRVGDRLRWEPAEVAA